MISGLGCRALASVDVSGGTAAFVDVSFEPFTAYGDTVTFGTTDLFLLAFLCDDGNIAVGTTSSWIEVPWEAPDPNALKGMTSLTFSGGGVIAGVGVLQGQSSILFSAVGGLTIPSLGGISTLTFTPAAALKGTGRLIGSSSISFVVQSIPPNVGILTGEVAFGFAPEGTLTGVGAIAGESAFTFSSSAELAATGALSGSSNLTFSLFLGTPIGRSFGYLI